MKAILLTLSFLSLLILSCRTNTMLDTLFYDTETVSVPNSSPTTGQICIALEEQGYHFSDFAITDQYAQISYPDRTSTRYHSQTTIHATLLTDIARDFETNTVTDTELESITQIATELCTAIAQQAETLRLLPYDIALLIYDPISGVTVNYNTAEFNGNCDQLRMGSVAFGGYGQPADLTTSICSR